MNILFPTGLQVLLLLAACLCCACTNLRPPEQATRDAPLELERYFAGRTRSWGMVEDRFGKVRQTLTADLSGVQRGAVFHLDQTFRFSDGRTERRQWQIRRVDDQNYEATANGIEGVARGRIEGGAVHLRYTLAIPRGEGTAKVQFDQWLWRQDGNVLFNRVNVTKFGILLARISEVFQKS